MTYVIMGPQGSGKGTQAELLEKEFGVEHVSVGDVLRKEVASGSETGKIVQSYMHEGKLIPLHLNNELVKRELDRNKNIILDGYPRNKEQAEYLVSVTKVEAIIIINISEEESVKRLSKRLICTANNEIFVEDKITDEDKKNCESLGGEIIKRDDDQPEAIKKRLQIYHDYTHPLIEFFKEKGIPIVEMDGEKSVQELFEQLKEKTKHFF